MGIAVVFGFLLTIMAISITLGMRTQAKRKSALATIARALDGQFTGAGVSGVRAGTAFALRFVTRGSGSNAVAWTEVDVDVPRSYPLSIHVRRHGWLDRGRIARGDMIDVELGDPEFDRAFLIEVAPADVARILLDAAARAFLSHYDPVELTTELAEERPVLRFAVRGWLEGTDDAVRAIDGATRLGARVREAYASAEAAVPAREAGSPYRPMVEDAPARTAAAARVGEVVRVEALKAQRASRAAVVNTIAIVVIAGLIGLLWISLL